MILQTEILSTETSGFLKQIIFPKSFNSVFGDSLLASIDDKVFTRGTDSLL